MKLLDYVTMPRAIISALLKIALTLIIQYLIQFSQLRMKYGKENYNPKKENIEN